MAWYTVVGQAAAQAAYAVFRAWVIKTQPVEAIKELITSVDISDLTSAQKRERVYRDADRILGREWSETKSFFTKDIVFAIAFDAFKKGM